MSVWNSSFAPFSVETAELVQTEKEAQRRGNRPGPWGSDRGLADSQAAPAHHPRGSSLSGRRALIAVSSSAIVRWKAASISTS